MGRLPHLSRMIIVIATPAARGTRKGNRVTALRWAGHLRALRHRVQVVEAWDGQPCDLLIALHATKSFPSVERYRARHPAARLVVGLAGTDLYRDLPSSPQARRSLELATRLTVLQPLGLTALPPYPRGKARPVIPPGLPPPPRCPPPPASSRSACSHPCARSRIRCWAPRRSAGSPRARACGSCTSGGPSTRART